MPATTRGCGAGRGPAAAFRRAERLNDGAMAARLMSTTFAGGGRDSCEYRSKPAMPGDGPRPGRRAVDDRAPSRGLRRSVRPIPRVASRDTVVTAGGPAALGLLVASASSRGANREQLVSVLLHPVTATAAST